MTRAATRLPNLVREHFTRAGKPKRGWATEENAAHWRSTHKGVKSKQIYLCSVCNRYHLGGKRS